MRKLLAIVALVALNGCDTVATTTTTSTGSERIARYAFHQDTPISEVTKTLPKGSVDYIDFDAADSPNVLVVVTATAPPREGLTFKTAFSGSGGVSIEKQWTPTTREGDHEHVGIFILPKSIHRGRTIRSRKLERASLKDSDIIFH